MVLLAEADWFYASPTLSSPPPDQTFGTADTAQEHQRTAINNAQQYHMQPVNGDYECHALDFCLCLFDLSTAYHGQNGCVVETRLVLPLCMLGSNIHICKANCKVVDATCYSDAVVL